MNPDYDDRTQTPKSMQLTSDQVQDLKLSINEVIWRYAPSNMTLGDAEYLFGEFLSKIFHYDLKQSGGE